LIARPLDGVTILDMSHVLAGPYGTMCLGDMGASVIKIESPGGDAVRRNPPFVGGMSTAFELINRNKESLLLDLRQPEGKETFARLVPQVDVVVENFRPGVMKRLGFDYSGLNKLNPRIVLASISGFGHTGPYAHRGGYDLMAQAVSGIMSVTGQPDGPPTKCGLPITDLASGLFLAQGVLLALLQRIKTGKGQHVDVSLYESAIALSVWQAAAFWGFGEVPKRIGNSHPFMAPYDLFRTSDGYIVAAGHDSQWPNFCKLLGVEEWMIDPRFVDNAARVANRTTLNAMVDEVLMHQTSAYWLELFSANKIAAEPIRNYAEVYSDPHTLARGAVVRRPGRTPTFGYPFRMSAVEWSVQHEAPQLGEQSTEVLSRFGFSKEEIAALVARGVTNSKEATREENRYDAASGSLF
jgi:crotonobetainyl-CoA:carnitine CoA-transferase CaiB-like acyl-CoA transferase